MRAPPCGLENQRARLWWPAAGCCWWLVDAFKVERWRSGFYTAGETPACPGKRLRLLPSEVDDVALGFGKFDADLIDIS